MIKGKKAQMFSFVFSSFYKSSHPNSLWHIACLVKLFHVCTSNIVGLFTAYLQQVSCVVNESHKTVEKVTRNLDGESRNTNKQILFALLRRSVCSCQAINFLVCLVTASQPLEPSLEQRSRIISVETLTKRCAQLVSWTRVRRACMLCPVAPRACKCLCAYLSADL